MRVRVSIANRDGDTDRSPEFSKPEITIGRTPSNDVVVPDAGVSGAHARVLVTGGALTIVDLDSTNGTFVNEQPLRGPRVLAAEDEVQIGDYRLRFVLEDAEAGFEDEGPTNDAAAVVPSGGLAAAGADWPEPPPMMDELEESPAPAAAAVAAAPISSEMRPAVFPPLERPATPAPPRPRSGPRALEIAPAPAEGVEGFELATGDPSSTPDRVFAAVRARIGAAVLRASEGVRAEARRLLTEACRAAERGGTWKAPEGLGDRMLEELVGDGPLPALLDGGPDEVLVQGTGRVRINRAGHVSEGPSPFSSAAGLAWVLSRVCDEPFDAEHPWVRGTYRDYAVDGIHGTGAGGAPVLSLRSIRPRGTATLDKLVGGGILSHQMASLLASCVVARQNVLLCAGPGASVRPLMAGLLACAPPQELQAVLAHRGVDFGGFRPGTLVVARLPTGDDFLAATLALGPERLAVDELRWTEAAALSGLVSRSVSLVLGIRSPTAALGVVELATMFERTLARAAARQLVMRSVDIAVTVQVFADGVSRVTQVAEPVLDDTGRLGAQDVFALVPGGRTWQFSGVKPRCSEELMRRGFPLDPNIFV